MLVDVAQDLFDIILDGIAAPIAEVACRTYGLILHLASWEFECTRNWLQASFTARASSAYTERPIRTWL